MKKQNLEQFMRDFETVPGTFDLSDFPDFDGSETVTIDPIYEDNEIRIWFWDDSEGNSGLIRDDNAGISTLCFNFSRDDQLKLAAWNADFDIRKLQKWLDKDDLKLALEDAKEWYWGFDGNENIWD